MRTCFPAHAGTSTKNQSQKNWYRSRRINIRGTVRLRLTSQRRHLRVSILRAHRPIHRRSVAATGRNRLPVVRRAWRAICPQTTRPAGRKRQPIAGRARRRRPRDRLRCSRVPAARKTHTAHRRRSFPVQSAKHQRPRRRASGPPPCRFPRPPQCRRRQPIQPLVSNYLPSPLRPRKIATMLTTPKRNRRRLQGQEPLTRTGDSPSEATPIRQSSSRTRSTRASCPCPTAGSSCWRSRTALRRALPAPTTTLGLRPLGAAT